MRSTMSGAIKEADRLEFLCQIIDVFEDFLTEKGIVIENEEREEALESMDPEEIALIYGTDYGNLSDELESLFRRWNVL